MGSKMCVHAPLDNGEKNERLAEGQDANDVTTRPTTEDGGSRRRNDSDSENTTTIQRLHHKVTMESKLNSTDFKCDPTESFRSNIANYCRRKRLPPLRAIHHFNFYIWSSNAFGFGHDSIVIGSHNTNDNEYGYITAELCVDIDEETVFPNTRFLNKYEAQPYLNGERKRRWKFQFSYRTTLDSLIDLVLKLIQNHGRYSNLHNGCQHFVEAFLHKIVVAEHHRRIEDKLGSNAVYQRSTRQCVRGFHRYLAHNAAAKELRNEGLVPKYDTTESTLQLGGTALVLPVIAMAISKETVKSQRHRVWFRCADPAAAEGPDRENDHENGHDHDHDMSVTDYLMSDGELSVTETVDDGGGGIKQHIQFKSISDQIRSQKPLSPIPNTISTDFECPNC